MLDRDLAMLYEVKTKAFNQAVKRNIKRFPEDFMFQLTREEAHDFLRSQIVTLKRSQHFKYLPYVFTQEGVAMLSGVLNSEKAIYINIQIMRVFIRIKEILLTHKDLREKITQMEKIYDKKFDKVFFLINWLLEEKKSKKKIGFK